MKMDPTAIAREKVRRGWRFKLSREIILLGLMLVIVAVMSSQSDKFLTVSNFQRMAPYVVEVGLISIGMTMVIIVKGIDISVGSIVGLCAVVVGYAWRDYGINIWLAALLAIAVGTLAGLLNGLATSKIHVPDLVVTLATLSIYRGIARGLTGGHPVSRFPDDFLFLGAGRVLGIPTQFLILIPAVIAGGLLLSRTYLGRYVFAMGNNETATRFSGINADRVRCFLYTLTGFLCGLASVIYVSRLSTARSNMGIGMEFDVITAVVLGGTSIAGGEGSIWGSILGVIIIVILRNGLNLAGMSNQVQAVLIGAILIIAVLINEALRRD